MSEVIHLSDGDSRASILVSQGFNCFAFQAAVGGQRIDTIWAEPQHAEGDCRPSGGGNPLLFPFPGRIGKARFTWEARSYSLEPADGLGNAIHGFAYDRPWRLIEQSPLEARAVFQLSKDAPDRVEQWPSDFTIDACYRVEGPLLRCEITATNVGDSTMPGEFGVHPYFPLPAGEESVVRLPASTHWKLQDMLPTGDCEEVPDAEAMQQGRPFSTMQLDDVFGGLVYDDDDICRASISGPEATIHLAFGKPFREIVVYTPPHRQSMCIEPYSCVPGDLQLGEPAGWTPMKPGEQRKYWFEISASGA